MKWKCMAQNTLETQPCVQKWKQWTKEDYQGLRLQFEDKSKLIMFEKRLKPETTMKTYEEPRQ